MTILSEIPTKKQEPSRPEGRPQLGEWCDIKGIARKRHTWLHGKWITEWITDPFADVPFRAMYIGWRVVKNGEMDSDGALWEVGFQTTRSLYVWLFVKDERSAPFYVFCRDVERLGDGAE